MRTGARLAVMAAAALAWAGGTAPTLVSAAIPPPPPPPPVDCKSCSGPPAPPTAVPTPAPTVVAPQPVVTVHVVKPRVSRGHTARVSVEASTDDRVTLRVLYHGGTKSTFHATVGQSGKLIKSWKVSKKAPLGHAVVRVTVQDPAGKVERKASLQITR